MSSAPLVLASELRGRPVVAIDCGDDIAEIKDVVFDPISHRLEGFTLNKRGWFRGKLKATLPAPSIAAIGPVAVMVSSADDLVDRREAPEPLETPKHNVPVMDSTVMSAGGESLGTISDVVLETGPSPIAAGYKVDSENGEVFVPISAQMSLSEDNLILPEEAQAFVRNDLAGFGAAVLDYRASLDDAHRKADS